MDCRVRPGNDEEMGCGMQMVAPTLLVIPDWAGLGRIGPDWAGLAKPSPGSSLRRPS